MSELRTLSGRVEVVTTEAWPTPEEWSQRWESAKALAQRYPELLEQAMEFSHSATYADGLVWCTCGWSAVAPPGDSPGGYVDVWGEHYEQEHE